MRSFLIALTGLGLTLNPARAPAQSVPKDVESPQSETPAAVLQLPNGARVKVVLAQTVSTRTAKAGDTVEFRVLDDVKAGPLILIAEGAEVSGTIVTVEPPRRKWKSGSLSIRPESVVTVTGRRVSLRASAERHAGPSATDDRLSEMAGIFLYSYGLATPLLPFWALRHGKDASALPGTVIKAYLDEPLDLDRESVVAAQPERPKPRSGPASVTIYHLDDTEPHVTAVFIGKEKIINRLDPGGSFQVTLPPGGYWFKLRPKETARQLQVSEGGDYYVRVYAMGTEGARDLGGHVDDVLEFVPANVGRVAAAATQSAKPKDVKDLSKVNWTRITADPR